MTTALWIMGAYLLGSIPTGLLLGKLYGIDVRSEGSGNIGATNLYRTVGRKVGIWTLLGDCLKGFLPVILAWQLGLGEPLQAAIGLAAFCGHVFSIFLLFKGGKALPPHWGSTWPWRRWRCWGPCWSLSCWWLSGVTYRWAPSWPLRSCR